MYENKREPLIDRSEFGRRMLVHVLMASTLIALTIAVGIAGHIYFDNMKLVSALVASVTLASGLGLSIFPETTSGQLFASLYGILSGYIYVATSSILIAPILHRILHKFHLDEQGAENKGDQ